MELTHSLRNTLTLTLLAAALTACGGGGGGSSTATDTPADTDIVDNSPGTDNTDNNSDSGSDNSSDNDTTVTNDVTVSSMTPVAVGIADHTSMVGNAAGVNGQLLADGHWILSTRLISSGGNSYSALYLSYIGIDSSLATPMTFTGASATLGLTAATNVDYLINGDYTLAMVSDPVDDSVWVAFNRSVFSNSIMTDTLVLRRCTPVDNSGDISISCSGEYTSTLSTIDESAGYSAAAQERRHGILSNGWQLASSKTGNQKVALSWGYNISESNNDNIAINDATDFRFYDCGLSGGVTTCAGGSSVGAANRLNYPNLHVKDVKLARSGNNIAFAANTLVNPYFAGPGAEDDFYETWTGTMGDGTVRFADNSTDIRIRGGSSPTGTHVRSALVATQAGAYLLAGRYDRQSFGDDTLALNVWTDMHYCTYQDGNWETACYPKALNLTGEAGETFVGLANEPTLLTTSSQYLTDAPLRHRLETHTRMAFMSIWSNGSQLIFRPGIADLTEILLRQESGAYMASNGAGLTISSATLISNDNTIASTLNVGQAQNAADIARSMQVAFVSNNAIAYTLMDNQGGIIVTHNPGTTSEASELLRTAGTGTEFNGSSLARTVITETDGTPVIYTRSLNSTTAATEWQYRIAQ